MDFKTFKKEWADAMVYNPKEFDYENTMHELYIHYKHALSRVFAFNFYMCLRIIRLFYKI